MLEMMFTFEEQLLSHEIKLCDFRVAHAPCSALEVCHCHVIRICPGPVSTLKIFNKANCAYETTLLQHDSTACLLSA